MGLNDKLADGFVSYAVDLSKYSAMVEKEVAGLLKQVELNLVKELNSYDITAPARLAQKERRLRQLLKEVRGSLKESYTGVQQFTDNHLGKLATLEATGAANIVNTAVGYNLLTSGLSHELLDSITRKTLIEGAPAREWWSRQAGQTLARFQDNVRLGMASGETVSDIVRRVRGTSTGRRVGYKLKSGAQRYLTEFKGGIMDVSTRNATALVRTSVQAISQSARLALYVANEDVLKGFQALVTLDNRTSTICMTRSGKAWKFDGTPFPGTTIRYPGSPPWHFNCRSTMIPIVREYSEIAGNISPQRKKLLDKNITNSTQASMDGQVAGDLNYGQWLKTKPAKFQQQVLGKGKHKLWSEGKLSFKDLTDNTGMPISLAQLQSKYLGKPPLTPIPKQIPKPIPKPIPKVSKYKDFDKEFGVEGSYTKLKDIGQTREGIGKNIGNYFKTQTTPSESAGKAISRYTNSNHTNLNGIRRGDDDIFGSIRPRRLAEYKQEIEKISAYINSNTAKEDIVVWRNFRFQSKRNLSKGSIIKDKGFVSTSASRAARFYGINAEANARIVKILIPKGTPMAYIEKYSSIKGEFEVLLDTAKFKVVDGTKGKLVFEYIGRAK